MGHAKWKYGVALCVIAFAPACQTTGVQLESNTAVEPALTESVAASTAGTSLEEATAPEADPFPVSPPLGDPSSETLAICDGTEDWEYVQNIRFSDPNSDEAIAKKEYVLEHMPSTVQLEWKSHAQIDQQLPGQVRMNDVTQPERHGYCTGTLISPNRVITAGHCFWNDGKFKPPAVIRNGVEVKLSPEVIATLLNVNFGYHGTSGQWRNNLPSPRDTIAVKRLVHISVESMALRDAANDYGLDWAIIELEENAPSKFPPAVLAPNYEIVEGDQVYLLQHPHGHPMMFASGPIKTAQFPQDSKRKRLIGYERLDTDYGSSGAGIRNAEGELIGVHILGGCKDIGFGLQNHGVPLGRIKTSLDYYLHDG